MGPTTVPVMEQGRNSGLRVAVVQAEPVYFDLQGAVEKAIRIVGEAAAKGAQLVAFPEVWIPGYPSWIWFVRCPLPLSLVAARMGSVFLFPSNPCLNHVYFSSF